MNYTRFVGYLSDYCGLVYMLHMMWLKLESSQSFIWHYIHVYNVIFKNKKETSKLFLGYYSQIIYWPAATQCGSVLYELQSFYKSYIL